MKASVFTNELSRSEPLTEEAAKGLALFLLLNREDPMHRPCEASELADLLDAQGAPTFFAGTVMVHRLAVMTPDVSYVPAVVLFLATAASSVGEAVIYAYSLYRETQKAGQPIDIETLCATIMPWGVPNEDTRSAWWADQKIAGTIGYNGIDTREFWQ